MKFTFTEREIDLISEALKYKINYYKGWILLKEIEERDTKVEESYLKALIRELQELQAKTTYPGQPDRFK